MIPKIENLAKKHFSKIAIGLTDEPRQRGVTIAGALQAYKRGFVEPILIGRNIKKIKDILCIHSDNPAKSLVDILIDGQVDGIVRGSLVASEFMNYLKVNHKDKETTMFTARLALIQSSISDNTFLIAPIGIDEGFSIDEKIFAVKKGINLLKKLNIVPKVSVMAGGLDPQDIGRHPYTDSTIRDSNTLIAKFENDIEIFTDGIVVEKSIEKGANFIICINGINGNLLFRSLIRLSSDWKSFGSLLLSNASHYDKKIIVDTSQYSVLHEYRRSLTFASAMAGSLNN